MLRRGLAIDTSDVALITNVAEDHLGEFGVHDLDALAACKFIVAKGARRLVLNADDPVARRHAEGISSTPITWFSLGEQTSLVTEHVAVGGWACFLERGRLVLYRDGGKQPVVEVSEIPIALGGAARYNVANALAAIGVAAALGVPLEAIGEGLRTFTSTPEDNPGRLNTFTIRGAQVILDFAHNPHGMEALLEMAKALPSRRWLVTVGRQATATMPRRATWHEPCGEQPPTRS
jgi:UDP-N-acetylmuramyl tripeptide synthase